jgi:phytoene synthase
MTIEESYAYCVGVARSRARNFYYSFVLLSRPQRFAICAMYAFMRYCDDLSDDASIPDRATAIARWRRELDDALEGRYSGHPVWPAFHDAVTRYGIPSRYFHEMIEGVSSDLEPRRVKTFDELYGYCYQVASVVGLTIIHIFGFESPRALELAERCGIAFQLTNILRDVREDAQLGRVYLPAEDLTRFGVSADLFATGCMTREAKSLFEFEAARAEAYYQAGWELVPMVSPESRASLWALIEIYHRLLRRIQGAGFDVLSGRVRVSTAEKGWIVVRGILNRSRLASRTTAHQL